MVMPPLPSSFNEMNEILGRYNTTKEDVRDIVQLASIQASDRILDVPCGFGRIAHELHTLGFEVDGIDLSSEQIQIARKDYAGPMYSVGEMDAVPSNTYDVILNIYSSFGYLSSEMQDQACLDNWFAALRPGGRLVMEVCDIERSKEIDRNEAHLLNENGKYVRKTGPVCETIHVDYDTGILSVDYEMGAEIVTTKTRLYRTETLIGMLSSSGFADIYTYGSFSGRPKTNQVGLVIYATKL